jgi:hypothetical protein
MTLIAHTEQLFPGAIKSLGYRDHEEADGLFVVTIWSAAGLAVTALTIWLGLGGQIESMIGLG